jgi:hypothetical protein
MRGVMKISSSRSSWADTSLRKSHPSSGIWEIPGTPSRRGFLLFHDAADDHGLRVVDEHLRDARCVSIGGMPLTERL